ncbi:hypothetical protein DFJ73DRAFT_854082 [Zopfochytrium polystomum]|nr:hypothetical protein DFJ73DRAFT_854082 [Zopfochytrium polystomum]
MDAVLSSLPPAAVLFTASIGAIFVAGHVLSLASTLANAYLLTGASLKKYGAAGGKKATSWAVVTGASDGIGKEFALQLARAKFNVLLLARTKSKLDAIADEATKAHGVQAIVHPFDFAHASDDDYARLRAVVEPLESVGVLVNNVGVSHAFPVPFLEESQETIDSIVAVNIQAQMRVTRIVAPKMVAAKRGLILNIGSVSGTIPSGLLSVYSASKAFLRYWSIALATELKPKGVDVEHATTYFVQTAMSKIRKSSWTTPTPKAYVRSVLSNVGKGYDSCPHPSHAILMWALNTFTTESYRIKASSDLHISIRKRALKKLEREAKKN